VYGSVHLWWTQTRAEHTHATHALDTHARLRTRARTQIKEGVVSIYKERANMAASLKDTDSIVQSLETAIGGVIHFIFVAFYLLIWDVELVEVGLGSG